jgi:hypothetical protein
VENSGGGFNFFTGNTERMRLTAAGKVGIGTSNPPSKFTVAEGTDQHGVEIQPGTVSYIQAYDRATSDYGDLSIDAQTLRFATDNGAERVRIDASGKVGIGTDTPDDKLDIVGDLRISVNKTANTNKTNRIRGEHYDITEEPTTFMFMNNFATTNALHIGGGSSVENAATQLNFYTAANNTTTAGTGRMVINSVGNVGIGTGSPTEKLDVTGNVKHEGLIMTSGTDIDQLKTFTQTLTITTSWQDTGIDGSDLTTGTYIVQLLGDDDEVGGAYSVYYSGMMSWFSSGTNDADFTSEIALHRAGHADVGRTLYLRTSTNNSGGNDLELQIAGNYNATGSDSYVFKFRRMI